MKNAYKVSAVIIIMMLPQMIHAQNIFPANGSAGVGSNSPDASSILEMKSTTKGMLTPRMTKAQRDAIVAPATGLMIYQTSNTPGFYYFDGSAWTPVTSKSANQSLSNLSAVTAINQHLLPGSNALDLGKNTASWRKIFINDGLYNASFRIFKSDSTNTAAGINTLTVTTGKFNTAIGAEALRSNTTGLLNTAAGASALLYNTSGSANTATGNYALYSNTAGSYNVASGFFALALNTTGSNNVANGDYSLYSNQTGYSNIAIGSKALYKNTTGSGQIAVGDSALLNSTSGDGNTAIGNKSLIYNTTGYANSSTGSDALSHNTEGSHNSAFGIFSMFLNTFGSYNTALGNTALFSNVTGGNNTAIGSGADVSGSNLYNATAIGADAAVDAGNKVRIGNTSVTSIGGQVGWTTFSDGRYKKNIKENVPGLEFINGLRPLTYTVDISGLNSYFKTGNRNDPLKNVKAKDADGILKDSYDKAAKIIHTGFIAQEVEAAANKLGYDFSGVDKPENKDKLYGLRYEEFVVPLVKAVQELSAQNEELEKKYERQQREIDELKKLITANAQTSIVNKQKANAAHQTGRLEQNQPNPTDQTTLIKYFVPGQNLKAVIKITNSNGQEIKSITLSSKNSGQINVQTNGLIAGTYLYSLVIDGKTIDTKKMVIIH